MRRQNQRTGRKPVLHVLIAATLFSAAGARAQGWPQWGGPHRNFHADGRGLAATWPAEGPRRIWSRELGDGYSAISVEGERLYTLFRRGEQDVAVCLDAATGKTVWEHAAEARFSA